MIEGAGSPAEINLRDTEIVNMRVARYASAPVLLCGDIDRGGVFAALVGTMELLEPPERETVKGFVINKFRGDPSLLTGGLRMLEQRTGVPVLGVVHHFRDIHVPEEDAVALDSAARVRGPAVLDVAVIQLPHLSNFDDFDPLAREPGVGLRYAATAAELGHPDLIILPGSKATISDLAWMDLQGLCQGIVERHRAGAAIIGICGGYQMLGTRLRDPEGIESSRPEREGLGLLPLTTVFAGSKETHRVRGEVAAAGGLLAGAAGAAIQGYEIHVGRTAGNGVTAPFRIDGRPEGAMDDGGQVFGTYVHGLFHNGGLRRALLAELARRKGVSLPPPAVEPSLDAEFDKLADWVRASLKMDAIYEMAEL